MQPAADERPLPFRAFVERAAEGRNSLPRIVIGSIIVLAVWFGGTFAILAAGVAAMESGLLPAELFPVRTGIPYVDLVQSPTGMVIAVATLGMIWPGVWLALRIVHRRRLSSAFGAGGRIDRSGFLRAAAVTFAVAMLASTINLMFEETARRSDLPLHQWVLYLLPVAAVLLVQTSAEEILFRGYLMQSLAQRFRSWIVWGALPALVFAVAHWSPGAQPWMNGAVVFSILLFAAVAVALVWITGNLGAAMGMHFANNVVALTFLSASRESEALSLYITPPIDDPGWTMGDAVAGVVLQAAMTFAIVWLLASRRSPLRLGGADPA